MSIDFDDSKIISGDGNFITRNTVSESDDESDDGYDYSTVSEESLEKVFETLSPDTPDTYEKLKSEYNKLKNVIYQEKKRLTSKKKLLRFKIDELIAENTELKDINKILNTEKQQLEQAFKSLVDSSSVGLHTFPKNLNKSSKGGKKRKNKTVSRRR